MLDLELRVSPTLIGTFTLVHAGALVALFQPTSLPLAARLALGTCVVFGWLGCLRTWALLSTPGAVRRLRALSEQRWRVLTASGGEHDVEIGAEPFVTPWLVLLSLRGGHGRRWRVLLVRDNVGVDALRRVRLHLRQTVGAANPR